MTFYLSIVILEYNKKYLIILSFFGIIFSTTEKEISFQEYMTINFPTVNTPKLAKDLKINPDYKDTQDNFNLMITNMPWNIKMQRTGDSMTEPTMIRRLEAQITLFEYYLTHSPRRFPSYKEGPLGQSLIYAPQLQTPEEWQAFVAEFDQVRAGIDSCLYYVAQRISKIVPYPVERLLILERIKNILEDQEIKLNSSVQGSRLDKDKIDTIISKHLTETAPSQDYTSVITTVPGSPSEKHLELFTLLKSFKICISQTKLSPDEYLAHFLYGRGNAPWSWYLSGTEDDSEMLADALEKLLIILESKVLVNKDNDELDEKPILLIKIREYKERISTPAR